MQPNRILQESNCKTITSDYSRLIRRRIMPNQRVYLPSIAHVLGEFTIDTSNAC